MLNYQSELEIGTYNINLKLFHNLVLTDQGFLLKIRSFEGITTMTELQFKI